MLKYSAPNRLQQFDDLMSTGDSRNPAELVKDLAGLSRNIGIAEADALLAAHPHLFAHGELLTQGFYDLAVTAENDEIARIRTMDFDPPVAYSDIMVDRMTTAYERVSDIFGWLDFANCRRFVMIGCGQVPVTALHVCDRFDVAEVVCADIRTDAVQDAAYLFKRLGRLNMKSTVCSGQEYDYTGAGIVYVANMVKGKAAVVARALETAGKDVQIVVRAPVGLAQLWNESIEDLSTLGMRVTDRGHVSRLQSQDLLLARSSQRGN